MNKGQKFYFCKHCGNLIGMIYDSGVNPVCCGEKMILLTPNTVEASNEKHLPVVSIDGNIVTVRIGSVDHPMVPEHFIHGFIFRPKTADKEEPCFRDKNLLLNLLLWMTNLLLHFNIVICMDCGKQK
jgi:hypothetical protein